MFDAAGHRVEYYEIVRDDPAASARAMRRQSANLDAIIVTGGTGIAPRDSTAEAVEKMLDKELPGFGELFRMLSYQEIGSAAFLSRAVAGIAGAKSWPRCPARLADAASPWRN